MADEAGKASGIEKFDGTDFAYWRMQIEDYLYFLFLIGWEFGSNSLQLVSESRVRFEWEQWQRKQERRLE